MQIDDNARRIREALAKNGLRFDDECAGYMMDAPEFAPAGSSIAVAPYSLSSLAWSSSGTAQYLAFPR